MSSRRQKAGRDFFPIRAYRTACIAFSFLLVVLLCSRFYYAFIFLPEYHGSFGQAAKRLVDFDGWWAYARSAPGAIFHILALASLLICAASMLLTTRHSR